MNGAKNLTDNIMATILKAKLKRFYGLENPLLERVLSVLTMIITA
jgi:hypothetical protein